MSPFDSAYRTILSILSPTGSRARLMILTFHQIPQGPDPIQSGLPHGAVFANQMRWLEYFCNVISLPEAAEHLREGTLPARAACITFDDGYANNLDVAAPILKKFGLPATFFITAGAVENGIMWNDLVIEGIRRGHGDLDLEDILCGRHKLADDIARHKAIQAVIGQLKYRQVGERFAIACEVFFRAAGHDQPRLMMTAEQVSELAALGFDIGAHTVNHPILNELSSAEARREIEESRDWVEQVTGKKPLSFAYPNGRPGIDFAHEHEEMVREAGFSVAVSTRWACARRADSPFSLPRFTPWERKKRAFSQRLIKAAIQSYVAG